MKTTIKERLIQFIKYKHIGQGKFEKAVGLSNGYICNLKSSPTADKLQMILSAFPDLNQDWLMTGEGDMLINDETAPAKSEEQSFYIPLIPYYAQGGELTGICAEGISLQDCERVLSPLRTAEAAITVHGDSMAPKYPSGSRVFIRRITESAYIDWGSVYVIDTVNGVIIKKVTPSSDPASITCHSLNPDPSYAPFEVSRSDIYAMFRVLGVLIIE